MASECCPLSRGRCTHSVLAFLRNCATGGGGGGGDLLLLKCCFTSTETVGLLGTGAQDVHLDFHAAPELGMGRGGG